LPVTCIHWGPVAEVGLAAADDIRGKRLESEGIAGFSTKEYTEALSWILRSGHTEVAAMRFDHARWVECNPSYTQDRLLDEMAKEHIPGKGGNAGDGFRAELGAAGSLEAATSMMEDRLREILAGILKTSPSRIDADAPFANLGVDSLMAIQLRNKLDKLLGMSISVTIFWNYPKVRLLAAWFVEELGVAGSYRGTEQANRLVTDPTPAPAGDGDIGLMTNDEVYAELDKELGEIFK